MARKKANKGLVAMTVQASSENKTYAQLQMEETNKMIAERERTWKAADLLELQQYRQLGPLSVLKKQLTPKTAIPYTLSEGDEVIDCPKCHNTYYTEEWGTMNYCPKCGQALKITEESSIWG